MSHEIALFWAVVAGFLIADNVLLLPSGRDFLRFGRSIGFKYEPRSRLEAMGRDLVFLNPLDLFDRVAITSASVGQINASQFRNAMRMVRHALPRLNAFAWVGYVYLLAIVVLAATSFRVGFELVLYVFITCHVVFWVLTTSMLLVWRRDLALSGYQAFVYAAEALFVPAYNINMGKRLWFRHTLDLPAFGLGLRQLRSIEDESSREFYVYQLGKRLDDLEAGLGLGGRGDGFANDDGSADETPAVIKWVNEARSCLTI